MRDLGGTPVVRDRQYTGFRAAVTASYAPPALKAEITAGIDRWLHA